MDVKSNFHTPARTLITVVTPVSTSIDAAEASQSVREKGKRSSGKAIMSAGTPI